MLVAILGRYSAYKFGPDRGSCPESVGFSQDMTSFRRLRRFSFPGSPASKVQAGDRGVQFSALSIKMSG
jgi:hypothetical protein